jgi:hypothetical protein
MAIDGAAAALNLLREARAEEISGCGLKLSWT